MSKTTDDNGKVKRLRPLTSIPMPGKWESQGRTLQVWFAVIVMVGSAVFYISSFAKASDVARSLGDVHSKLDAQHDELQGFKARLDVHQALMEHMDGDLHQLLKKDRQ